MSSKFLKDLPQETRTQIYGYILAPTGRITIKRNPGTISLQSYPPLWSNAEINLNLLQTCKQISREAKAVLWQDNIFFFLLRENFPMVLVERNSVMENVRTVEVQFTPIDVDKVITYLPPLGSWARNGSLREVRFTVSGMGMMTLFGELVMSRRTNTPINETSRSGSGGSIPLFYVLGLAGNEDEDYLPGVKRKLHIGLRMGLLSNKMRREWFEQHPPAECEDTLNAMHHCLGGELYVDGKFCYKDGVRLRETFTICEVESYDS